MYSEKTILERTIEVFRLFENELVQIKTKKIRLARFREIKPLAFPKSKLNDGLLGRSKDFLWIMAIQPNPLTEEDIVDFVTQCHRLRYAKQQRRVIITNSSMHTNVRLKAMEEKVLTWNIDDLNLILDLYDKPRVILR